MTRALEQLRLRSRWNDKRQPTCIINEVLAAHRSLLKEGKNRARHHPDSFGNTAKFKWHDIDAPYSAIYGRKI